MATYEFPNVYVSIAQACHYYIYDNVPWKLEFNGISGGRYNQPVVVYINRELTENELSELTSLMNGYVDPSKWLDFNRTTNSALHSHYTTSSNNTIINDNIVLQNFIFSTLDISDSSVVLDGLKTIIEYNCPNVQNFLNITSGNSLCTNLNIYDITRHTEIANQNVNIDDIVTIWHNLAQTGNTEGNIQFKSVQYTGLMNKCPNYDCIWQLQTSLPIDTNFKFRCHSLQYLYYNVIYPIPNPDI